MDFQFRQEINSWFHYGIDSAFKTSQVYKYTRQMRMAIANIVFVFVWFCLIWFDGISTIVGYFMPKLLNVNMLNV